MFLGKTDGLQLQKHSKPPATKDIKSSVKSSDDKVAFRLDEHFVDDYQHYPPEFQRLIFTHINGIELAYSLCEVDKLWSEMIVEDKEV